MRVPLEHEETIVIRMVMYKVRPPQRWREGEVQMAAKKGAVAR